MSGIAYDGDRLKDAVKDAQKSGAPIELLVKNGDAYSTVKVDYRDGLRYPQFERDESMPALLDDILAARP